MLLEPNELASNQDRIEDIEKTSLRLVVQALHDYRDSAGVIFRAESDEASDIGEDITREALDRLSMPRVNQRLFGKVDYKRACYLFHPDYTIRQALFVDSKAEQISGNSTATLQITQLSMTVNQVRSGAPVSIPGRIPTILSINGQQFITTTIFVKYSYRDMPYGKSLEGIIVSALPNGLLQQRYNPDTNNTIWLAGRNAPSLGEEFRVRLSFRALEEKASWRVQRIPMEPASFVWHE